MKTLKLNAKSWHYKLANEFGGLDGYATSTDMCTYARNVSVGALLLAFLCTICVFITVFVSYLLVETVLSIAFGIVYGFIMFTPAGFVGSILCVAAIIGTTFIYLIKKYKDAKYAKRHDPKVEPDNFIYNAYKGWKEKYCAKIEIINNDEIQY